MKVVSEFLWGHPKCHFFVPENGHFWQKCPSLGAQKWHFWCPNKNSETTFISPTSPKNDGIDFRFKRLWGSSLALFKVLWVTWETPGYIASLMREKPKSVVSHSVAAAPSSTVKLFYQTPASNDDFICIICHKSYKSLGTMGNHLRTKHGKTLVMRCEECGTVFEDWKALNRHTKAKRACTKLPSR